MATLSYPIWALVGETPLTVTNGGGVSLDLGVFYQGTPDVTLNQTGGVVAVSQADLDAEEKNLEDDLDDFEFYPVATIGIHFRF